MEISENSNKANKANFSSLDCGSAISPIDGRYRDKVVELAPYFSEKALMRYRLLVEVEYLIALSENAKIIRPLVKGEVNFLRQLYQNFSDADFLAIKEYEKTTKHDVNAVVRYFKERDRAEHRDSLEEIIHFGLTSEDVNNLSFALMLMGGVDMMIGAYKRLIAIMLDTLVYHYRKTPLLALTHGQPASPTTVGWEIFVFVERLLVQLSDLKEFQISVKFGGATGGHNALCAAYPLNDWRAFSSSFINRLYFFGQDEHSLRGPKYNPFTTQIEPHDTYAKLFQNLSRLNTVLIDFSKDMWMYIARNVFTQKPVPGEDGSSAMPHKVNPIDFENAEGNLGVANALFAHFAAELPISRFQRHLSDSTIIRNFGTAFAHSLLSVKAIENGLKKVYVNTEVTERELENNWGVVAEAYQTILRREKVTDGYDLLKKATRGTAVTKEQLHFFIEEVAKTHNLSGEVIAELMKITPHNYIGNRQIPIRV